MEIFLVFTLVRDTESLINCSGWAACTLLAHLLLTAEILGGSSGAGIPIIDNFLQTGCSFGAVSYSRYA